MSDVPQGDGWWQASDGRWYAPEQHPDYQPPPSPTPGATQVVPQVPEQLQPTPTTDAGSGEGGGRRKLLLGLVAAIVLVGGGFLAFSFLSGSSGGGTGAGSPEAAVEGLVASVDQGDVIGLLSSMDPAETQSIVRLYEALVGVAPEQGGLTFDEAGLIDGLELSMGPVGDDELVAEVEIDPDDDDRAVVRLRSLSVTARRTDAPAQALALAGPEVAYAWSTAEFPTGTELTLELEGGGRRTDLRVSVDDESAEADGLDFALEVVTVRRNGDWYVSPASTTAAIVFDVLALDEPDWDRWRSVADDDNAGGETPEQAVEQLFESAGSLEIDEVLDMVDPEVDRVIHAIWPPIEDAIGGRGLDRVAADADARTDTVDVFVEEVDGETRVILDRVAVTWDDFGDEVELSLRRWCLQLRDEFGNDQACIEDFGGALLSANVGFDAFPAIEDLLPADPYLVVNERNRRWFVSPLDTLVSWTTELQAGIEADGELPASPERSTYRPAMSVTPGETVTVDDADDVVVAVSLPMRNGYRIAIGDDDFASPPDDQGGAPAFLRERFANTDFAVVTVTTSGESDVQFREGFTRSTDEASDHRAVIATREQLERTTPAYIRSASGSAEVSVAWVDPVTIEAEGTTSVTLGDEGVAVVALLTDFDEAELVVTNASASDPNTFSRSRTVNLTSVDNSSFIDGSGTRWVAISGDPGATAEVTLTEFNEIDPPPPPPEDDPPVDPPPDVPFNGVVWAVEDTFSVTLDPLEALDFGHYAILSQSLEYLFVLDEDQQPVAWLAEAATANADATVWQFSLRDGVVFHDGSRLDAADVVYSLERVRDQGIQLPDVVSVTVVDDLTVEVVLAAPDPDFPVLVSDGNPQTAILADGDVPDQILNGTGPFILADYRAGDFAFFEVNFTWWAGLPPMDTVEFRFFSNSDAMLNALRAGEVDGIQSLQPFQVEFLEPEFVTRTVTSNAHRQVWMRTDRGPFADVRVRQALALTIDRALLVDGVLGGFASLGNDTPIRSSATDIAQRVPDLEAARQLLADAGFADGLSVTLNVPDFGELPDVGSLISAQAAEAGFDITLNVVDTSDFFVDIWCPPSLADESCDSADFGIVDYGHRAAPDVYLRNPLTSEGTWNVSFFADSTYDALFETYQQATTPEEAAAAVAAMEEYLHEQLPIVVPYFIQELFAHGPVVDGVTSTPLRQLNFANAFIVGR